MEETEMSEKLRIYVGGLGPRVEEDDLKRTFGSPHLGNVEHVEIIRTKGRGFAYMEFVPASDKALAKLFSSYNGCMWKGGRLKLEKAREHYLFRLKREWTEDAELADKLTSQDFWPDESMHSLQNPKQEQDIAKMQLQIFFPKLRKIKPVPLKGTGKHKYSFQRVEVPPLPINFCDCEEHSVPSDSPKKTCSSVNETDALGINEEELNIMKSVLNKLLEKENISNTVCNQPKSTEGTNNFPTSDGNLQTSDSEEDQESDDDGLVINVAARPSKRVASFEDWGQKITAASQDSSSGNPESSIGRPINELHGREKRKILTDNKRKVSFRENDKNGVVPPKKKVKKGSSHDRIDDSNALGAQPTVTVSGSTSSRKLAWRALASEKTTDFHISDILTEPNHELDEKPGSDPPAAPYSTERHNQDDQSNKKDDELEKLSDDQPDKPSVSEDKPASGALWMQKSPWLQMVGDTNSSSFSIGQLLPGVTYEKQESQLERTNFSFSRNENEDPYKNKKFPRKVQRRASSYASPGSSNVIKGQDLADLDGGRSNPHSERTVEQKDEMGASMPRSNMATNNRASVEDIVISETCPFMKSAASMKEWAKTKAVLSGALKKKGKAKDEDQD